MLRDRVMAIVIVIPGIDLFCHKFSITNLDTEAKILLEADPPC